VNDATLYSVFVGACGAYTIATIAYFVFLGTGHTLAPRFASASLLGAVALHVGFLLGDLHNHVQMFDIRQMLTVISLAIASVQLISMHYGKLAVLGAFVTPIALLMLLAAGLGHSVPEVPEHVRSMLLPAHVLVNVLGLTAFTLAFAVASAYLIQERLLRRRRISGVFTRLPPLDVLDSLGLKLLLVGFPLFTAGSVSGAIWAAKMPGTMTPAQMLGLVAWAVFATVLLLRVAAGWQGKRAAIGTLVGFACALCVLVGYAIRATTGAL
jgi:ABC-type uncharacterized transport system permease subunit